MPRATPLSADERRVAIMAATEPLVERFGREVTTRQIAEAAGVAEGTIFRVFPSKEALLDAVLEDVLDAVATRQALLDIDTELGLDDRLAAAVEVLQTRMRRVVALFHALRSRPPEPSPEDQRRREEDDATISLAIEAVIGDDAHRLRRPAAEAAGLLRSLTFAVSHPMLNRHHAHPEPKPREIVDLFLHGLARTAPCDPAPYDPARPKDRPC